MTVPWLDHRHLPKPLTSMLAKLNPRHDTNMDPLIAAQVYNQTFSPIYRFPEEILLPIINDCISVDPFALPCLWRVSRIFHLLITDQFMKGRELQAPDWEPNWETVESYSRPFWVLRSQPKNRSRLQRDRLCPRCKDGGWGREPDWNCWFNHDYDIYCRGCGREHSQTCFDISALQKSALLRKATLQKAVLEKAGLQPRGNLCLDNMWKCLGHTGSVKLCEHMHIYWHEVESHILKWQQKSPKDWMKHIHDFTRECGHKSHDRRSCGDSCAPSWPRACIRRAEKFKPMVILHLEWMPHTSFASLGVQPQDKQFAAPALRKLFQSYQDGAGGVFFPSHRGNALPEMTSFRPSRCCCVKYEMGETEVSDNSTFFPYLVSPYSTSVSRSHSCYSQQPYGFGENGADIFDAHTFHGRNTQARMSNDEIPTRYQNHLARWRREQPTSTFPGHT